MPGRPIKAMIEDDKEIRRGVDTVGSLVKAGETPRRRRKSSALSKKFPTNPTVLVLPNLIAKTMTLDEMRDVHAKQIENIRLAMVDLQVTATMAKSTTNCRPTGRKRLNAASRRCSPKLKAILAGCGHGRNRQVECSAD